MPPIPSVSPIVWRSPNRFGTSKSSRVAACPPTWIMLIDVVAAVDRRAPVEVRLDRRAARRGPPLVQRAIASAASSRSGSMSCSAIVASASSGNVSRSPSRFFVNSTLPAPMNAIRVMRESVSDLIETSKNVHGRGAACARPAVHAGRPSGDPGGRSAHQARRGAQGRGPLLRPRVAARVQARSRPGARRRTRPACCSIPRSRLPHVLEQRRVPGPDRAPGVARAKRRDPHARRAAGGRAPAGPSGRPASAGSAGRAAKLLVRLRADREDADGAERRGDPRGRRGLCRSPICCSWSRCWSTGLDDEAERRVRRAAGPT